MPPRRLERNLLVVSWSLNKLGKHELAAESLFWMAQILSAFDIVALQEIDRDLTAVQRLIRILGPEWGYLITDPTEGRRGNNERFAIMYYAARVAFDQSAARWCCRRSC